MIFQRHQQLEGRHARLSASKYHWVNDDDEKLIARITNELAKALGTRKHEWAAEAIRMKLRQGSSKTTLNMYINDAIKFRMKPEVVLAYSNNIFGTADAIDFRKQRNGRMLLRIHDLKTGVSKASFMQLMIYAALFCLEYDVKPGEIDIELRIYQNDDIQWISTTAEEDDARLDLDDILHIMGKIKHNDEIIERLIEEAADA